MNRSRIPEPRKLDHEGGTLGPFDEVIALRVAEHTRASRYVQRSAVARPPPPGQVLHPYGGEIING